MASSSAAAAPSTATPANGVPLGYEMTAGARNLADDSQYGVFKLGTCKATHTVQSKAVGNNTYRHVTSAREGKLTARIDGEMGTVYHIVKAAVQAHSAAPMLGKRTVDAATGAVGPYVFISYADAYRRIRNVAAGLRALGNEPGAHIGIYSKNRVEWQLASEACHTQTMVSISLYDTLGPDSSLYIVQHGEIRTLFCSGEVVNKVIELAADAVKAGPEDSPNFAGLKHVITFDTISAEQRAALERAGGGQLEVHTFAEVEALGANRPVEDVVPTPDHLSTIMYTSGTTGKPKGVMLTHRAVVAGIAGVHHALPFLKTGDSILSYLPLAHIFERAAEALFISIGGRIGYWQGDIKALRDDIQALKPTMLPGVPRVFDRFYDAIKGKATDPAQSSALKRWMFDKAFSSKKYARQTGGSTPIWDWLVFSKLKAVLGGQVTVIVSGGAPLRGEVQEFLGTAFDCPVVQGYGLTETCAGSCLQALDDLETRRVGGPMANCEIKLIDVPEMKYFASANPPQGEVLIRGAANAVGYYKMPDQTKEVFLDDGFFATGDIGQINADGSLSIIDRRKNIFKLAQGEYVAVEALELKLNTSAYLTQLWLYGESTKTSLVAVGVVEPTNLAKLAAERGVASTDLETLCKDPKIVEAVLKDLDRIGTERKLLAFEKPRAITLLPKTLDLYSPALLTPSFKLVRNELKKFFQADIDRMYAGLPN